MGMYRLKIVTFRGEIIMLKVYDKLWYVKRKEEDLAYMTYYAEDKAFEKRKDTGNSWAHNKEGVVCDNKPLEGFIVGQSVSRYSTSNKLFRVIDPRGFEVEIPTDNLAMLLQSCTITNSVVQEKCVWGREGNNHILLNESSEPYKEALSNMDKLAQDVIKPKDHQVGDLLSTVDGDSYLYLGKIKVTYDVSIYKQQRKVYGGRERVGDPVHTETLKDKTVRLYYCDYCADEDFSKLSCWQYSTDKSSKFVSKKIVSDKVVADVIDYFKNNTADALNHLPSRLKNKLPEEYTQHNGLGSYYADYVGEVAAKVEFLEENT